MKALKLILTLLLLILFVIFYVYDSTAAIISGIVIGVGIKFLNGCLDKKIKFYEEELKKVEAINNELQDKSEHNYLTLEKQLDKLKNIIERESSYYEAQKVYFYIKQAINNENLIMEKEKYLELVETFKKLEKKMLQLPLKR